MRVRRGRDSVILFSGGLDLLAGAIETLERTTDNVILVTHRSAQKMIPFQDGLVEALPSQYRKRVRYIPIDAKFRKIKSHDTTQRSRSFLFAAFGFVIARLVGADSINFFENGVVSHNLPISPQVIGTMATRTTHPLALAKLEHLLSLIHGSPFPVRNPFAWRTKTDIVTSLAGSRCGDADRQDVELQPCLETLDGEDPLWCLFAMSGPSVRDPRRRSRDARPGRELRDSTFSPGRGPANGIGPWRSTGRPMRCDWPEPPRPHSASDSLASSRGWSWHSHAGTGLRYSADVSTSNGDTAPRSDGFWRRKRQRACGPRSVKPSRRPACCACSSPSRLQAPRSRNSLAKTETVSQKRRLRRRQPR